MRPEMIVAAALLAAIMAVTGGIAARRAWYLLRLVRAGRPLARFDDVPSRVATEAVVVLGQRKLFQRLIPGIMHVLIFWGFLVLLPTIIMAMLGTIDRTWTIPWLGEQGWFALIVDLFAAGVLVGVGTAFAIRLGQRPVRFVGSRLGQAYVILIFEAAISLSLFLWHGSRIALELNEYPAAWSPISAFVGSLMPAGPVTEVIERGAVWVHVAFILAFLDVVVYSKHLHTITAPINVFFGRTRAKGRLEPLVFDDPSVPDDQIRFGTGTIRDMTWKQVVDVMACTECGRCQDACPAFNTGKKLSPKLLVMGIRDQLYREGHAMLAATEANPFAGAPLVPAAVTDEVVWDCVTCGACVRECPVGIEHIDHIVDLRRNLVMVESRFPTPGGTMLRDLERTSNPWGRSAAERVDWTEGLNVRVLQPGEEPPEVLYWVGCAPAFDERARISAISTAKLLQEAGVDFAILGERECCTGDPARRMGDEYTFQAYAKQNVETLNESKITTIVTTCPHCYNTIGNEYRDFGGSYRVLHHTELLAELVRDGRLKPLVSEQTITYHDSCYLARHNDVRSQPREIVSAVGKPLEMARNGERTFCCGSGGSHMWLEEGGEQINEARARQAAETGAEILAVACPFCTVMLDDGVQSTGAKLAVKDVATLLVEAVERGHGGAGSQAGAMPSVAAEPAPDR